MVAPICHWMIIDFSLMRMAVILYTGVVVLAVEVDGTCGMREIGPRVLKRTIWLA